MSCLFRVLHDAGSFPPSLHLLANKYGDWPIRMPGAQTAFSMGVIANYLFDFATQIPVSRELNVTKPPSLSDSSETHSPKMKLRDDMMEKLDTELSE